MTAISDLAQARIDALYPDEGYNLKNRTYSSDLNQSTPKGPTTVNIPSGAAPTQFFLFSIFPQIQTMPTLDELKELFLKKQALGEVSTVETSPTITSNANISDQVCDKPPIILIFLYLSIFAVIICVSYFYFVSFCVGLSYATQWIRNLML